MTLFTKQIEQINFEDVKQFVTSWPEGVRVEYKMLVHDKLPRSISSFANTLGGVIVVGVREDQSAQPPNTIVGIDKSAGIKEGIIDSSVNNIYPSIVPDVKVIELPSDSNKVVVVIKVSESDLAPHAIQNSTRVYIRRENITELIDLADIDRIEFLLKRRENSKSFRDELIGKMLDHCKYDLSQAERERMPMIQVVISPLYPYKPIIGKDQLYSFAQTYSTRRQGRPFSSGADPSRISDGVYRRIVDDRHRQYNRLNVHGCLLSIQPISQDKKPSRPQDPQNDKLYLHPLGIIQQIWDYLELMAKLYEQCDPPYKGNLLIKVKLRNVLNKEILLDSDLGINTSNEDQLEYSEQIDSDALKDIRPIVKSIAREILWAFQLQPNEADIVIDSRLRLINYGPALKS